MLTQHSSNRATTRPHCTQPSCLLKQRGMCQERLAECLVALLAGKTPDVVVPGSAAICPRPRCANCAMRVIKGSPAFFTIAEWERLDALGRWHHCRERRRASLGH